MCACGIEKQSSKYGIFKGCGTKRSKFMKFICHSIEDFSEKDDEVEKVPKCPLIEWQHEKCI